MIDYNRHIRKILDRQNDLDIGGRMNVYRSAMRACEVKFSEGDPKQYQEQQKQLASVIESIEAEYTDQLDMRPADPINDPVEPPVPTILSIVMDKISRFPITVIIGLVALISIGFFYLLWDNMSVSEEAVFNTSKIQQGLSTAPTTTLFSANFANDRSGFQLKLGDDSALVDNNNFIKNGALQSSGGTPNSKNIDIFGSELIPINASTVYSATAYVRYQEGVEAANRPDIFIGVITYANDNPSNIIQDNPRKYFVIRGKPRQNTFPDKQGWLKLTGQISQIGGNTHKIFAADTTFMRPVIRLETNSKNSTVQIKSFVFERVEAD